MRGPMQTALLILVSLTSFPDSMIGGFEGPFVLVSYLYLIPFLSANGRVPWGALSPSIVPFPCVNIELS